MSDGGSVWVRVPAGWVHSEGDAVYVGDGGRSIGPVLGTIAGEPSAAAAVAVGDVPELATLPVEVRSLVHAVDAMRDHWAEAGPARRDELWRRVHLACDAVWGRLDPVPADSAAAGTDKSLAVPCWGARGGRGPGPPASGTPVHRPLWGIGAWFGVIWGATR